MSLTSPTVVERAHDLSYSPVRNEIVLSASELRDAHGFAAKHPQDAAGYLADADRAGHVLHPRTREFYAEAARFVTDNGLLDDADKPEPTVTHTYRERVLPPIQTDELGNRFLEAADGSYRFTFLEVLGDDEIAAGFEPRIIPDSDPMDERLFPLYAEDAARFAREIAKPVASSWNWRSA